MSEENLERLADYYDTHCTITGEPIEESIRRGVAQAERGEVRELPGLLHSLDEVAEEFGVDLEDESCPRCGGDHAWCQWVQPGEFGEES